MTSATRIDTGRKSSQQSKTEKLAANIEELRAKTSLDSWNALIHDLQVPSDLLPAMMTQRTQLIPKGRALDAAECQVLYDLIAGLINTNAALREHTQQTGTLVSEWVSNLKGAFTLARHIETFANFKQADNYDDEEPE